VLSWLLLDAESGDGDDEMSKNGEGFINKDPLRVSRRGSRSEEYSYVAHASTTTAACRAFLLNAGCVDCICIVPLLTITSIKPSKKRAKR